jgi:long-chain acyl-CoA synthetase
MMENSPDVPVLYNAIARAGAVATPVIFLLTAEELRRIVADAEPALIVTSPTFADTVRAAAGEVRVVTSLDELDSGEARPIVPRADDDLAALVFTGGTTGRSKGVMLTHANLYEAGIRGEEAGRVEGIERSLGCLPLAHVYGLLVLQIGMHDPASPRSVLMRWFDAARWLELVEEHRIQIAALVPSMIHLLLAQPLEEHDLSSLRFVASGAAPLAAEARAGLERRLPGLVVREGYGLTEASGLVSSNWPETVRPGTVGQPPPGTEIRIADDGEILVRSPTVMAGYWRAPELTAEALRDGWLYTGDVGRLDEDGCLTIVDRKKDVIIRGGFNVYPRDVEEALLEHPAVATACVVGRPDPVRGEEVVAFVALGEGAVAAEDELVAFGRTRLGGYKYPREVHLLPALPLTPVGKVDRKALRALLTETAGAAGGRPA